MGCCKSRTSELSQLQGECDSLRSQLVTSVRSKPFTEDTVLLNGILEHLWPHISQSVAKSLAGELEPSIRLALSKLPSPLNKCSVKDNSHLGTKPVRILAPAAAWSSTSSFTISGRLEWDSNSSISLSFTGASLAIINFFIMGDFTIELLLVPGKSAAEFVSAVRAFFPYPPDIQFDIERSQLALAANLATLHRMLLRVMSQKLSEKLVFPNCQGISFSSVDLLDVRHPPAEGLLSLNIQIRLNTPGAFSVETVFGSDVYSSDCKPKAGADDFQLPTRCFVVRSSLHQQILVKLRKKAANGPEKASFFRVRVADLIYRTREGAWSPAFQSDGPEGLESTADALTLTTQWWPLCSDGRQPSESGKEAPELISVGICSAQVLEACPGSLFWVVARLEDDILPARRTGQKRAAKKDENWSRMKAAKMAILEKYKMTKEDMAKILEDPPKVIWLQSLDFALLSLSKAPCASTKRVTLELWKKAPGKSDVKLGAIAVDMGGSAAGRQFQKISVDGGEVLLEFRVHRSFFMKNSADLPPDVGVQIVEPESHENILNAVNAVSAASNALAAVGGLGAGALAVAMDEGIAAVGGAYSGLSAAAQAGIEGLSSTWAFATDFEQPSPKSEELAQPGNKRTVRD